MLTAAVLGLATGCLPIISYIYGSKQYDRIKKVFWNSIIFSTSLMIVFWVLIQLFPRQIVSIFGTQDELYMEFASLCLRYSWGR